MFGFQRSAFETEGWYECGGGLLFLFGKSVLTGIQSDAQIIHTRIVKTIGYKKEYVSEFISFITSKCSQWRVATKDSTKGGDGSAKNDGAGVQHKHNFQVADSLSSFQHSTI
ncbi:hypothetical protein MKW98_002404 [Papaver atlanticum]|uniref:Uncharacterized protein n=1 Tax=Papaver atlanticum TaxID=357466 RepID=A0AAD4SC37_9MAGN|nr:hypothetical protein MKW98_002404 [Papaver atlanticum]